LHATIFTKQGLSGMIEGDEGLYVCVCEREIELGGGRRIFDRASEGGRETWGNNDLVPV
jgi:hypothetical protein